ncbi:hypothetical protein A6M21_08040 [Desulfotomaculum copahuensis]|uniref:Uncharacterized protein n=1 Tax=Desulfotomaculum copahuensis TaxID=1838280 RepID=A0A1B7LG29_9FIRM|nr:hypothetical protein A6M21_08040 [Desulfotomaculum copahuensis]
MKELFLVVIPFKYENRRMERNGNTTGHHDTIKGIEKLNPGKKQNKDYISLSQTLFIKESGILNRSIIYVVVSEPVSVIMSVPKM